MMRASRFEVTLPAWVGDEVGTEGIPEDLESRMRLVNRLADRNWQEGTGGPFAAAVFERDTGELIAAGVNLVLSAGLSSMHAEVVTLSLAQATTGNWDLGGKGRQLVVNWRPCAMCYGAVLWSGVDDLVIAGAGAELETITGFDEGPMREDWREQLAHRGVSTTVGVLHDEAIAVFRRYAASGATVYNPSR